MTSVCLYTGFVISAIYALLDAWEMIVTLATLPVANAVLACIRVPPPIALVKSATEV
jgi:hypothetical protein